MFSKIVLCPPKYAQAGLVAATVASEKEPSFRQSQQFVRALEELQFFRLLRLVI